MKKVFLTLLFIFTFVQGAMCASITIDNMKQEDVIDKLVQAFISKGATIENTTNYSITVLDVNNSLGTRFFFGSALEKRYTISAVQKNQDVLLNLTAKISYHTNTAYQENMYSNSNDEYEVLKQIKKYLNGYYTYGLKFKKHINYIEVVAINYNCLPIGEELSTSDKIIKINDVQVKQLFENQIDDLINVYNKPSTKLKLTVKKSDKTTKNVYLNSIYIKAFGE